MAKVCTLCNVNPQAKGITRCKLCNVDYMRARKQIEKAATFTLLLSKPWGYAVKP